MRKIVLFVLISALLFTVMSCSNPTDTSLKDDFVTTSKDETSSENTESTAKRVKLLMMGDSTTSGDGSDAAFRFTMYQELLEAGCFFETVGDCTSADYRLATAYKKHFAKRERRTDELTEAYKSMVEGGKIDYDIAVITIGINDLSQGSSLQVLNTRYIELLDTIFNDRPDAKVFFAELIRMPGIATSLFNVVDEVIAKLVDEYKAKGYDITLLEHDLVSKYDDTNLDHYVTFGPNLYHPNHIGNVEIGKGYAAALKDAILTMNAQPADENQTKAVPAKEISLSETEVFLKIKEQIKIKYIVSPENSDVASAVLTSSDPSVATINRFGVITAHKAGTATITARVTGEEVETTCTVTVSDERLGITIAGENILLKDSFNNANAWGKGTQYITSGELCQPWSSGMVAETKESYTISKDAGSIGFKCLILEQIGGDEKSLLSVTFGAYELQFCSSQASIKLLHSGKVIGTYTNTPQYYPADDILINFVDGKVTVYRNNETLITADAPEDAVGKIGVSFPEYGILAIDDLVVRSGK